MILLMILAAACRPQAPPPFPNGSPDKPGTYIKISFFFEFFLEKHKILIYAMLFLKHSYVFVAEARDPQHEHGSSCVRGHHAND